MALEDWVDRLTFWEGLHPDVQTLLTFTVGIAAYTMVVFAFYQKISQREPFQVQGKPGAWTRTRQVLADVFLFPLTAFGYFIVLTLSLFLLAKTQSTAQILMLSMSVVVGVRVTAFLSDVASADLAKVLPWSLFAVLLVDPGFVSLATTLGRIGDAIQMVPVLFQYFVLFILVDAALRGLHALMPALRRLGKAIEHRRHLSKRGMLRDVRAAHAGHAPRLGGEWHEHAPRDRSRDFLRLDEAVAGKPGRHQGIGPARAAEARAAHRPAPRFGPEG